MLHTWKKITTFSKKLFQWFSEKVYLFFLYILVVYAGVEPVLDRYMVFTLMASRLFFAYQDPLLGTFVFCSAVGRSLHLHYPIGSMGISHDTEICTGSEPT